MNEDIIRLKKIGLTEIEAKIFLHLLKKPGQNPTQIAKELEISRSSSYNSVDHLEKQNIVKLLPASDDRKNYKVINPEVFLELKRKELNEDIDDLKVSLNSVYNIYNFEDIYNFENIDNLRYTVIDIVSNIEREAIILGSINDEIINNELYKLKNSDILCLEFSSNDFVLLIDRKNLIIVDENSMIYTKNTIFINQVIKRIELEMEKK